MLFHIIGIMWNEETSPYRYPGGIRLIITSLSYTTARCLGIASHLCGMSRENITFPGWQKASLCPGVLYLATLSLISSLALVIPENSRCRVVWLKRCRKDSPMAAAAISCSSRFCAGRVRAKSAYWACAARAQAQP